MTIIPVLFYLGCQPDLLQTIPHDRITSAIFWNNIKDAQFAANAIYTFLDGTDKLHRDVFTDIAHTNTQYGDYKAIEIGAYNGLNSVIEAEWTNDYKGIHAANYFLENIDKVSAKDQADKDMINHLTGEVRFIRAYLYVHLVFIYGNVPLVTKSLSIDDAKNLTQSTAEQLWDFIETELTDAVDQLPVIPNEEGRITKGAALALQSRAMLYAKRYQASVDAAQKVMDQDTYSLFPSYAQLFSYGSEDNSEVILDNQYLKDAYPNDVFTLYAPFSLASNGVVIVPLKKITDAYQMANGLSIEDPGSGFDPYNPYKGRDPRLLYSIFAPGSALPNGEVYDSRPNSGSIDAVGSNYQVSVTGYNVKKYVNKEDIVDGSNCGINIILIRYAEVLLNYAEAKIELNQIDASVFDAINKIRQRPDVHMPIISGPKSQDQLREIVRHERMVELAFEGQRFFDIRRWGIADKVLNKLIQGITYSNNGQLVTVDQPSFVRNFKQRDYLWPIPKKELDLNVNLKQNPGW